MANVHKKASDKKQVISDKKEEPVVVSDVVTKTTERIEVIEKVTPDEPKSEDPLARFKEKMSEEESLPADIPAKKNFMWPILFVFIIALFLLGGIFIYKQGMNSGTQVNVLTLTPTPTIMPEPTIAVDLSKYEIKVLNGSETSGEAGRQKESLEKEGFTISSIGNAANSDYTKTIIQAKKEVDKAYLNQLKSVLESSFTVSETEELSSDADSDIVVIIGSSKN